jgi:hypothetical protein
MIRVGIVGITGYTGEELLKILLKHKQAKIAVLAGRSTSEVRSVRELYPHLGDTGLATESLDIASTAQRTDVVFLALPHRVSFEIVPEFMRQGKKVIDLSADFRLNNSSVYEKWYGGKHTAHELLAQAVYGLPELYREKIRTASLIANPGCYPTTVLLGLAPVIRSGLVDISSIIIVYMYDRTLYYDWDTNKFGYDMYPGLETEATFNAAEWHFVVLSWSKFRNKIQLQVDNGAIYEVDGIPAGSLSNYWTVLAIGDFQVTATIQGAVDEFGVWGRVLTTDEKTELYNAGAGKTYPFPATPPVESVSVDPATASIYAGAEVTIEATVTGGDGVSGVTWTAPDGGSVLGGVFTAPETPGTYTVIATSVEDNTKSAAATITVSRIGPNGPVCAATPVANEPAARPLPYTTKTHPMLI